MSLTEQGLTKTEIHDLIATHISEKLEEGKIFTTLDLAEEIVADLKVRGLHEVALLTYINGIVIDLLTDLGYMPKKLAT